MFVVTLPASAKDPRVFAQEAKDAGADVLEIRGDLTPAIPAFDSVLPLLLSPRGAGQAFIDRHKAAFIDMELGEQGLAPTGAKLIRSIHDHGATPQPEDLRKIIDMLLASDAEIIKLATTVQSYEDVKNLLALHDRIPANRNRVILGMGPKAHLLRLLSPIKNALTYTYLHEGQHAAPGQIPLGDYAAVSHCRSPKLFGLLGGMHIAQSLSPRIHNTLCASESIDACFALFPTEDLQDAWTQATAIGVQGFSVTAPWKRGVIAAMDNADPLVDKLGSANTLVKGPDGWTGYNTDVIGLERGYDIPAGASVAIIGSGGVVPAIIEACRRRGAEDITVYARKAAALDDVQARFDVKISSLESLSTSTPGVVVCAISDDVSLPLPPAKPGAIAIDLRYWTKTKFLTDAELLGYQAQDGLPMLVEQALEQFRLFHGRNPSRDSVLHLRRTLSTSSHGE